VVRCNISIFNLKTENALEMVRSTRKAKMNRRNTIRVPRYAFTMSQLSYWFRAMHDKLGWMTLAKAKGLTFKIVQYKRSLNRLLKSIDHLMAEYKNVNRKHDLAVLQLETRALKQFADRYL